MENTRVQFQLDSRVSIVIPGTRDVDKEADNSKIVDRVAAVLAGLFGGASIQDITGLWIDAAGKLVKESNKEVYSYCNDAAAYTDKLIDIAQEVKQELTQEAVLITVNGSALFV